MDHAKQLLCGADFNSCQVFNAHFVVTYIWIKAGIPRLTDDGNHEARRATCLKVSAHREYRGVHSNQLIKQINKISNLRNLFTFTMLLSHTVEGQQLAILFNINFKTRGDNLKVSSFVLIAVKD